MTDLAAALEVVELAWAEERTGAFVVASSGEPVTSLPDLSEDAAHASAARAQAVLDRLDALVTAGLPADLLDTLSVVRATMRRRACAGRWWWTVFDPMGIGFWAVHAPTAYGGSFLLSHVDRMVANAPRDTVAHLLEEYARLVGQLDQRTRGQAQRGTHLPRVQLEQAVGLVAGLRDGVADKLARGSQELHDEVTRVVVPAFDRMLAWLSEPQRREDAGEQVGMAHLPGGAEVYRELVAQHLTLDLEPQQVHDIGLQRLERVRRDMQAVADELGEPDARAVLRRVEADPVWRADTAEGIAAHFERYTARMAERVDEAFAFQPRAPYGVEPLPEALSGSMTFGFYDRPGPDEPRGLYRFNAQNLRQQHLASIAALTFHELVPGHHLHFASQQENLDLHPLRQNAALNAFSEGWAEYAATLAGELGLYRAPEERFGHLLMDAFLSTRLVVDTGMNALGWSLEQARQFMRENAFVSEAEVLSESVRYSCDLPGQALAYKLGESFLVELRDRLQAALGDRFTLAGFHDVVLRPGGLPLSQVAANVDRAIAEVTSSSSSFRARPFRPVGACTPGRRSDTVAFPPPLPKDRP